MKKIFFAAALAGAAMLASCGGNKGGVQLGSLSEFDSLSYSLGANIGYGMSYEMKDIPFDFKAVDKGVREGALGKATQEHDKSLDMLREYFMTKRGERAQAVAQKRAEADSVRLAACLLCLLIHFSEKLLSTFHHLLLSSFDICHLRICHLFCICSLRQ